MELLSELTKLCTVLNRAQVKYVVVGGIAVILHGYYRTTHDIDLLVDSSPENVKKIKTALGERFDSKEELEINDHDLEHYMVIRFAPLSQEIVIDFMSKIGEISFEVCTKDLQEIEIEGIKIPLCGLKTLIETKRGMRPKDQDDLLFLLGKKEYLEKKRNT